MKLTIIRLEKFSDQDRIDLQKIWPEYSPSSLQVDDNHRIYAALQSLQAGLNQSDDPAEIAKYLKANSVDTVMGPLTWDEKGDLKGFEFGVFDWHANGTATDAK